jgi:MYXO-CTERM domain-containing protein
MARLLLILVLGSAMALASAPAMAADAAEVTVGRALSPTITLQAYYPTSIVVHEGDTVAWRAGSPEPHTVTQFPVAPDSFDSSPALDHTSPLFRSWFGPGGFLLPTQSFNWTFNQTGVFPYFCLLHDGMGGVIRVVNASSGSAALPAFPATATGSNGTRVAHVDVGWGGGETMVAAFAPSDLTIQVGDTVQWTNKHPTEPHTVTGAPKNPDAPPGPDNPFTWNSSPAFDFTKIPPDWFGGERGALSLPAPGQPSESSPHTEFRHTFDKAGQYTYFCKLHPQMWGTVTVLAKANASMMGGPGSVGGTTNGSAGGTSVQPANRTPGPDAPLLLLGVVGLALVLRRR